MKLRLFDPHTVAIYRRLLGYVRPYWRTFAFAVTAMVALASTEWMLPALLKPLIDEDFELATGAGIYTTPLLLIGLFLLRGTLSYIGTVCLHLVSQRTIMDLRAAMFDNLIRLPATFFDARNTGELISKFTFDVTQVAQATTRVVTVLVKDTAVVLVLLAYLLYLNAFLAAILITVSPIITVIVRKVSGRMREMSRRLQASMGDINQVAEEAVRGYREIKVFDGFELETERFRGAIGNARKFHMKVIRTSAMMVPLIQFFVALGIAVMVVFALKQAADGSMTRGDFIAFVTATALLLSPVKRLAAANEFLQRGIAASESVFQLTDAVAEPAGGERALNIDGAITFDQVSIRYGDQLALQPTTLTIEAGETIALVGRSGGGKTSLVNLVPRFYEPSSGQVLIDGRAATEFDLNDLRRSIAYVGQNVVLFNDTLYNNIAYGAQRGIDRDRVEEVAQRAQVSAFAASLDAGLDSVIGENGVRLSGGQRQRVALARALLKDAPILILDEATAALDNEAEREVQAAIETLRSGRTSLIVAHRLSTILNADRIVVMDSGRIVEVGKHEQLLAASGPYARLHAAGFDGVK